MNRKIPSKENKNDTFKQKICIYHNPIATPLNKC